MVALSFLRCFDCYYLIVNLKISLIVPVYNEVNEVENFFNELKICNFNLINEIIFVDDCSTDGSSNLLEKSSILLSESWNN